jgi:MFS family permease
VWRAAAARGAGFEGLLMARFEWRPWLIVAAFSLVLFLITASTYSALGVVLPNMVGDEHWSWSQAGFGFTLLGMATGGSSFAPAFLIRKLGVRPTLFLGTAVMASGFACLGVTHDPAIYFVGTALCGVGYQMMAMIPGTYVLAMVFKDRGLPFGVYFASASAAGVAGPVMAQTLMHLFDDHWRVFWMVQAAAALVVGALCILLVGGPAWLERRAQKTDEAVAEEVARPPHPNVFRTAVQWTANAAMRTPQFYILLAAYFGHLLVGIVISSFSVAHLTQRGASMNVAVLMLSIEGLAGVAGRTLGGAVGDRIDPRHLLLIALAALVGGSLALSLAHGYGLMLLYALGSGLGFGLAALAVTLLLLNYYGRANNLEIFARTCLIGAVSALGSWAGGAIRDHTGSFALTFQLCAGVIAVIFVAVVFMRPPVPREAMRDSEAARQPPGRFAEDPA